MSLFLPNAQIEVRRRLCVLPMKSVCDRRYLQSHADRRNDFETASLLQDVPDEVIGREDSNAEVRIVLATADEVL